MTGTQREASPPWPTCERKSGRCQLYSEISDLEEELNQMRLGINALFNLLEGCSRKDNPVEFEVDSAYFFAHAFEDRLVPLRRKWETLLVAAGGEPDDDGPALVG